MRSFLQLFRSATKGVWVDTDATEGAVVGENLFIRLEDGSLALFQPPAGTVVAADGTSVAVTLNAAANARARRKSRNLSAQSVNGSSVSVTGGAAGLSHTRQIVPGSNSGYLPTFNPTTPQSGFDLDPWMVSGLPPALNPYPSVPKTAHGFVVGQVVRLNGSAYILAKADNAANAEAVGMVAGIDDPNHFRICVTGRVVGIPGPLTLGMNFLSATTAGALTSVAPGAGFISKPLFIAETTNSGYFVNMRGEQL